MIVQYTHCITCVDFPHPVSPAIITTWLLPNASIICSLKLLMGRFAWSFFNFTNLENCKRQWKKKKKHVTYLLQKLCVWFCIRGGLLKLFFECSLPFSVLRTTQKRYVNMLAQEIWCANLTPMFACVVTDCAHYFISSWYICSWYLMGRKFQA